MTVSRGHSLYRTARAGVAIGVSLLMLGAAGAAAAAPPPIRLSPDNRVPECVTPDRLMRFLQSRNRRLNPSFRQIAQWYKYHGESWQVRWDYAFYQMIIETNYLTYRAPNGRWGDVDPKQNNFAGIGTTGGGVPGNRFATVGAGVLAQIQHLVVYSGEAVATPVAPRTRLKQDHILRLSRPIAARRPITFQDLSGRWAVDRRYGRSIEAIARRYRSRYCQRSAQSRSRLPGDRRTGEVARLQNSAHQPRMPARAAGRTTTASRLPAGTRPETCKVQIASYGGPVTLLIRSADARSVQFTALDVPRGQEGAMAEQFIRSHVASGGKTIASYPNRDEAIARAHRLCKDLMR